MPRPKKPLPQPLHLLYRETDDDGKMIAELASLGYTKTDVMRAGLQALRNQLCGYGAEPARVMDELLGGKNA